MSSHHRRAPPRSLSLGFGSVGGFGIVASFAILAPLAGCAPLAPDESSTAAEPSPAHATEEELAPSTHAPEREGHAEARTQGHAEAGTQGHALADLPPMSSMRSPTVPAAVEAAGTPRREACPRTALRPRDLFVALARGHVARFGREPEERRLVGLWALAAFETSRGQHLYGHNFANLAAHGKASWCLHPTALDEGAPARLRSFASPTQGASALVEALGDPDGEVFAHLDEGHWAPLVDRLTRRSFFRADPQRYREALPRLAAFAASTLLPELRAEYARALVESASDPSRRRGLLAREHRNYSQLPLEVFVSPTVLRLAEVPQ